MTQKPKPTFTWTISDGTNSVKMGMYGFRLKDDVDPDKDLAHGISVCPVAQADNIMDGLYDPEQPNRMGFSQSRGASVATLSGSERPSDLTDAQLDVARAFLEKLENALTEQLEGDKHDIVRKRPDSLLEANEFELGSSTELHVKYDMPVTKEELRKPFGMIVDITESVKKNFNAPAKQHPENLNPDFDIMQPSPEKFQREPSTRVGEKAKVAQGPMANSEMLRELFDALMGHLSGSWHVNKRNEIFTAAREILTTDKNNDTALVDLHRLLRTELSDVKARDAIFSDMCDKVRERGQGKDGPAR